MQSIVADIYRGRFDVLERLYKRNSDQAFSCMENITASMKRKIPAEYHDLLREFEKSMMDLMDAACEDEFLAGYRLGVRMILAAWPEKTE